MSDVILQQDATEEQPRKICTRCKVNILLTEFKKKRDGTYSQQCNQLIPEWGVLIIENAQVAQQRC